MTPSSNTDPERRPTMADVAERAGVSRTLVSFILDGKPRASAETRQRVLAIADEIGYRRDAAARVLAQGRSRTIGVLMDVQQMFEAQLVTAIYPAARKLGHEVLLTANLQDQPESEVVDSLLSHRCGGLILLGPRSTQDYLLSLSQRVPLVVVGRRLTGLTKAQGQLATVRTNDAKGMRMAVDYLVGLGHQHIHHVDGGDDPGSADRRRAYRAAMRGHGLDGQVTVIPGAHNESAGMDAARQMLQAPTLPTAVLAGNDRCALGLLDVLTRAGVDVPGEVSLIGYDDSRLSDNPRIDLTTIHQDAETLAHRSVEIAVEFLDRSRAEPTDVVLEPQLVVRSTTAAPRG